MADDTTNNTTKEEEKKKKSPLSSYTWKPVKTVTDSAYYRPSLALDDSEIRQKAQDNAYASAVQESKDATGPTAPEAIALRKLQERQQVQQVQREQPYNTSQYTSAIDSQINNVNDYLSKVNLESDEDRKKREKTERARRIISAVGDGLNALSNLYFTTQYAPSSYNPENSLIKSTLASIEKAKKDREENETKYYSAQDRLAKLQQLRQNALLQRDKDKLESDFIKAKTRSAEAQAKLAEESLPSKLKEQGEKAKLAEAKAAKAISDAFYADKKNKAAIDALDRSNRHYRTGANGQKRAVYYGLAKDGSIHEFPSYKAALDFEVANGTNNTRKQITYIDAYNEMTGFTEKRTQTIDLPILSGALPSQSSSKGGDSAPKKNNVGSKSIINWAH